MAAFRCWYAFSAIWAFAAIFRRVQCSRTCKPPLVGPMLNASACQGIPQCGSCTVTCSCGTGGVNCKGTNVDLRCLGENDASRNVDEAIFSRSTCDASSGAGAVGLVSPSRCGIPPCCPTARVIPRGCRDALDDTLGIPGQCAVLVSSGTYSCEVNFCPTCGLLAGNCDKTCGYNVCAVCGDCWRESRLGVGRPDRCDDGNTQDGDGCSSTCEVEPGWSCHRTSQSATDMALQISSPLEVDICSTCTDIPRWSDAQGYTCKDYASFGVCDSGSISTDPITPGGRLVNTPSYFDYKSVYELAVRVGKPLRMIIGIQAFADAHIFIGKPEEFGFQIVIGGWNNGLSVLQTYPGRVAIDNWYGQLLNASEMRYFWVYYDFSGNFSVGRGQVLFQNSFLNGLQAARTTNLKQGWTKDTNVSLLTEVSVSTGWLSTGKWDIRLLSGSAIPTFADLANAGVDATMACCVCSGGVDGRPCDLEATGKLMTGNPRVSIPVNTSSGRRLSGTNSFTAAFLGSASTDGFKLWISFQNCSALDPCILNAIVVNSAAKTRLVTPLAANWPQLRAASCKLRARKIVELDYTWNPSACNMTAGGSYTIALIMAGSDAMHLMDFNVPKVPSATLVSATVKDLDYIPGVVRGKVQIVAAEDESDILQYRLFWGRGNGTKVDHLSDPNAAVIGWVNTYGGGGLRNSFDNDCIYSDCQWSAQLSKTAGWQDLTTDSFIIRHPATNDCLCYRNKIISSEPCSPGLLVLNSQQTYQYVPLGEGLPVDGKNNFYITLWYRKLVPDILPENYEKVFQIMSDFCSSMSTCVAFTIAPESLDAMYHLDSVYNVSVPGELPPSRQPVETAELSAWLNDPPFARATGPPKLDRSSLNVRPDLDWRKWYAFIKRPADQDCLWSVQRRMINSTLQSRLVQASYGECLCRVPAPSRVIGPDGQPRPSPTANGAVLKIGKYCDSPSFDFFIDDTVATTQGYCEWTAAATSPLDNVTSPLDANWLTIDAAYEETGDAVPSNTTVLATWQGVQAFQMSGAGFQLPAAHQLGNSYTLAAWVNIQAFNSSITDGALLKLFNAVGASGQEEPCFQVKQRVTLDGQIPFCPGLVCAGDEYQYCCTGPAGPTTTFTSTSTSVTSTATRVNTTSSTSTAAPMTHDCMCMCPENTSSFDLAELGMPTNRTDKWSLGFRACSSVADWDSGADLTILDSGSSWVLLAVSASSDASGLGMSSFFASSVLLPEVIFYNSSFGCASPGCTATAIIRDIPRDESRTCGLTVSVYITDFLRTASDPSLKVVERISITGAHPEWTRDARWYCDPAAADKRDTLFPCLTRYRVDEWIRGPLASRTLRVDVKISTGVERFPRNGMLLSGVASVECRRSTALNPGIPDSGSIWQVGVAGQTCSGNTIQAVGDIAGSGPLGSPTFYLAQAWAWDRELSQAEIEALYWDTRIRYYPDYQLDLVSPQEITAAGYEVTASGSMSCRQTGCISSVMLTGLPSTQAATCLLTVDVAITTFASPTQYIEYIKVDGITVASGCRPGSDGDGTQYYRCADSVDVSQTVLRTGFLNDGNVTVTMKVSSAVQPTNKDPVKANAEVHCMGFDKTSIQSSQTPNKGVIIQPEAVEVLAVSMNQQGEGANFTTPFWDKVNDFLSPPRISDVSDAAATVVVKVPDEDGMIWLYAVNQSRGKELTAEDVLAGISSDDDVCVLSHRRRGKQRISDFNADSGNVMTLCSFERDIPYTLLTYVDRANPPYGGGSLAKIDLVGPRLSNTLRPQLKARKMMFFDTNVAPRMITGNLTFISAASEANITTYLLYYGSASTIWPVNSKPFATVAASGSYTYTVLINTQLPLGVNNFLIFTSNSFGQAALPQMLSILDRSVTLTAAPTVKRVVDANQRTFVQVGFAFSSTGVRADVAIVQRGSEVLAKMNSDMITLDFGPLTPVCSGTNLQFDQITGSVNVGPCNFVPGQAYALIATAGLRSTCPCSLPCRCVGALSTSLQATSDQSLPIRNSYFVVPDATPPSLTLSCGPDCPADDSLSLVGSLKDVGQSYPCMVLCAACLVPNPQMPVDSRNPPYVCVRAGDVEAHRKWRIRIPKGKGCAGKNQIDISEVEFYAQSTFEAPGERVTSSIPPLTKGASLGFQVEMAFDGSFGTFYRMNTVDDSYVGLDFTRGREVSIVRVRVFYPDTTCNAQEINLEWSDDDSESTSVWTRRLVVGPPATPQNYSDVFVDASASLNWTAGSQYQDIYKVPDDRTLLISGLTPGTPYNVYCQAVDAAGNSQMLPSPFSAKTVDTTGPSISILRGIKATDYRATLDLKLRDPGKSYPALSTCVARQMAGQPLPPISDLSSEGQRCKLSSIRLANQSNGRVSYVRMFGSRLKNQATNIVLNQSSWGGAREEIRSCGLRQQAMLGPGGCGAKPGGREVAAVIISVLATSDIYLFIGGAGVGQIGYEILLGAVGGTKLLLRKGYSADVANSNLPFASQLSDFTFTKSIFDPKTYKTFWFRVNPESGAVQVGTGEMFGRNTVLEYIDPFPVKDLDVVLIGAGPLAGGVLRTTPWVYVCPSIGNLARGRKVNASSVAFSGTPDKVTDGQWGDMTFCEYCSQHDPLNVCASTLRQDLFNPPFIIIDLGAFFTIGYMRLIGPVDGLPEQTRKLSIYVGNTGFRSDTLFGQVASAAGDTLVVADPGLSIRGRFVGIWGDVDTLAVLPEEFGLRLCEVEVYEKINPIGRSADILRAEFARGTGLLVPFVPTPATTGFRTVVMTGLQPNVNFEVFCYAEDSLGNIGISTPLYVTTPDTTPPKVKLQQVYPGDLDITVTVSVADPGNAYPAQAKCIATKDGQMPQEQGRYFEHRFWRVKFIKPPSISLDSSCEGHIIIRDIKFLSADRLPIKKDLLSSQRLFTNPPTDGEDFVIGRDTNADGIGDTPEPCLWALKLDASPTIGIDLNHVPEVIRRVQQQKFLLAGDFSIGVIWNGKPDEFELSMDGPGSTLDTQNTSAGWGVMTIHCQADQRCSEPVLSAMYALAPSGSYDVTLLRSKSVAQGAVNADITAIIRVCGQDIIFRDSLQSFTPNVTLATGVRAYRGCGRPKVQDVGGRLAWQSSALKNVQAESTIKVLADGNTSSCIMTGGKGRNIPDTNAWWRTDLGKDLIVQGIWLLGRSGGLAATLADVYVSNGTARKATDGVLCALSVPVADAADPTNAPVAVTCVPGVRGSSVWVVSSQANFGLTLCEVEIITAPPPTVAAVLIQYGYNNLSSTVCGASDFSVEWSDDNSTWNQFWNGAVDPTLGQVNQISSATWWQMLFKLPFNMTFPAAGERNITIPYLHENTTYDVMCWGVDSLGNDLSEFLVSLPLPWGVTQILGLTDTPDYPGITKPSSRRLGGFDNFTNSGIVCSGMIRQLLPCKENIITTDHIPPDILEAKLLQVRQIYDEYASVKVKQEAIWEFVLDDGSCNDQSFDCRIRCKAFDYQIPPEESMIWNSSCRGPWCSETDWLPNVPFNLTFTRLIPGSRYGVECMAADPWNNTVTQIYTMDTPRTTTFAPTTEEPLPDYIVTIAPPIDIPDTSTTRFVKTRRPTTRVPNYGNFAGNDQVGPSATTTNPVPWTPDTDGYDDPAPSPPQATTTLDFTTMFQSTQPPQVTRTTTTVIQAWGGGPAPAPLGPLKAAVVLGASSASDAEVLQYPSAISAMKSALQSVLSLTSADTISIEGVDVISSPSAGRRLIVASWEIQVRFVVQAAGQVQSRLVSSRLSQLSAASSLVQSQLTQELNKQLITRNLLVATRVVSATTLQAEATWDSLPQPISSQPNPSSFGGALITNAAATVDTSTSSNTDHQSLLLPIVLGVVATTLVVVACSLAVVCLLRKPDDGIRSKGVVADCSTVSPDIVRPTVVDAAVSTSKTGKRNSRVERSSAGNSSRPGKEAWTQGKSNKDLLKIKDSSDRASTADSEQSTTTGGSRDSKLQRYPQVALSPITSPLSTSRTPKSTRSLMSRTRIAEVSSPSRLPLHGQEAPEPPEVGDE